MFKSLKHIAEYYDIHPDTLRRRFKHLPLECGEHFITDGSIVRYDLHKVHDLLFPITHQSHEEILNRLMV